MLHYKIALTGAHGTGKTTLVDIISREMNITSIKNTVRTFWEKSGVEDFEKIPRNIRGEFQKLLILNQIKKEDDIFGNSYITDRSLIDYLAYTKVSSDIQESDWNILKALVKERVKSYTHIIYVPIEFEAQKERLRADIAIQQDIDKVIQELLPEICQGDKFVWISGSIKERVQMIKDFIK